MAKITFKNKEGLKLVGILDRPKNKTKTCIILCHGRSGRKNEQGLVLLADGLVKAGFSTFRFDFRGHGESEGKDYEMTISGEKKDLEAAYGLLIKKGYNKFGLLATSFAGVVVSYFSPKHKKIRALTLLCTRLDFSSYYKSYIGKKEEKLLKSQGFIQMSNNFRGGKKLFEETLKVNPIIELRKLNIPIMFVHGDKDSYVPYKESVKYSKELKAKLVTINGGQHFFIDKNRTHVNQVLRATTEFFTKTLK